MSPPSPAYDRAPRVGSPLEPVEGSLNATRTASETGPPDAQRPAADLAAPDSPSSPGPANAAERRRPAPALTPAPGSGLGAEISELGAELREGASAAILSFADATVAPLQAGLGSRAVFLRGALVAHLASTAAAAWAALDARQSDWQVYLWAGAGGVVLVGNSMRWPPQSGRLRRLVATSFALFVTLVWAALLLDRAVAGALPDAVGTPVPASGFWAPTALLTLCGALLIVHFGASLRTLSPPPPPQ
ncbi:MAG: hypothetical protein EXR79_04075 [Myxococcales bacterium]|nr:hypothetical protein [Myxococcales bacterium]